MNENPAPLREREAWQALERHYDAIRDVRMRDLFEADPERFGRFSLDADSLVLDYSRNIATAKTIRLLVALARESGVETMRDRMFAGEHINSTENRAVLHVALRADRDDSFADGEQDCTADVHEVLARMETFVEHVVSGRYKGTTGKAIQSVVNIGIGGSDLGIAMATEALAGYRTPGIRCHTVSNIDGTQLADVTAEVDAETTLFVVCSKTFTTLETLTNANAARAWLTERLGESAVGSHFAAVSTNHEAMDRFGIAADNRFAFWDWVGGRYSLWSAVGLSIALAVGMDNFRRILAGGRVMDRHFRETQLDKNMPVLMALLAVWYNNFFKASTQAILPYDNRLHRFPAFLQQLQMESNGKRVDRRGHPVDVDTGAIIWGEAGSNAQHSFYQLLHQGTRLIPADFLLPVNASGPSQRQQNLAIANCLAQAQALMAGQTEEEVREQLEARGLDEKAVRALMPHKVHPGNRPSNTLIFPRLDPETLGKLVSLYEHKVFVEGVIWGINSFDQWGVELGKILASGLEDAVAAPGSASSSDDSIRGLLGLVGRWRESS